MWKRTTPLLLIFIAAVATAASAGDSSAGYRDLTTLFAEWRAFERPPMLDGVPDYTARTFRKRRSGYRKLRQRLDAIDPSTWPVEQQVDWHIVRAELNGFDFN